MSVGNSMSSADRRRRRAAVIKRDGKRCRWCGTTHDLTLDHKIPKARGGSNAIKNLQLLCALCNSMKGDGHGRPVTPLR